MWYEKSFQDEYIIGGRGASAKLQDFLNLHNIKPSAVLIIKSDYVMGVFGITFLYHAEKEFT